jgi:hypothetical protein
MKLRHATLLWWLVAGVAFAVAVEWFNSTGGEERDRAAAGSPDG